MSARSVLVVDDDTDVREAIVDVLREGGYNVLSAPDGDSALALLELLPKPCVVLLDHKMPGKSGAEVAADLQASPHADQLQIVIVSASALSPPEQGIAYLRKPFDVEALLALVEALSGQAEQPH